MSTESRQPESTVEQSASPERIQVRKTYKLFIGDAFPRSESGRSYPITGADETLLAYAALASRKDLREAVTAARTALPNWASASAYNRGQVLYRIAEMMEGRRAQFAAEVRTGEGCTSTQADQQVSAAIDRWVWYAGWTDKYAQFKGSVNPVAGPYFNFSMPEPSGVIGIIAPQQSSLLGFISVIAPALCTGNTVVVVASRSRPLPAITLTEALATADLPGGALNVLTGDTGELSPWLASHRDVNGLDLTGVRLGDRPDLLISAADNLKRVYAPPEQDFYAEPGTARLDAFVDIKTVWHPVGL